jgi:CheY-like chemotaxis protein
MTLASKEEPSTTMHVLIIESDPKELLRLAEFLLGEGQTVRTASSADGALELLAREGEHFQVVLVDVMLCGANGASLARTLRERLPGIRVVLTSPYHLSPGQLARFDCDGCGYITPELEPARVLETLQSPWVAVSLPV